MNTQYFRPWRNKGIQIIIPKKRIQFVKKNSDNDEKTENCNFDCFYYCYKMNLPKDILWIE